MASARRARERAAGRSGAFGFAPEKEVEELLANYLASALAWRDVHDFRRYMNYGPDSREIGVLWKTYQLGAGWLAGTKERLTNEGHAEAFVEGFLELIHVD